MLALLALPFQTITQIAETVPGMVVYVTHEPRAMTADVPVGILPKANDKYHHVGRRRSGKMGKWEACICHCSRTHNLGWYSSTHEAAYAYNVASKLLNHAAVPNVIASDNLPSPLRQQEIQVEVTFRLRCKKLIEESPGHKDHPQAAYRLYRVSAVSGYRGVSLNRQSNTWARHMSCITKEGLPLVATSHNTKRRLPTTVASAFCALVVYLTSSRRSIWLGQPVVWRSRSK